MSDYYLIGSTHDRTGSLAWGRCAGTHKVYHKSTEDKNEEALGLYSSKDEEKSLEEWQME